VVLESWLPLKQSLRFPSFDARRGRNLPTAEGPLFANLPSWRIPGTKNVKGHAVLFFVSRFLGGIVFQAMLDMIYRVEMTE